jgi:hypothetical protein
MTIAKIPECDEWCELGIWLNAPWKGGWLGLVANDNGHHWEPKFDNENEHRHLHIDTFQTFLVQLHKQEQILNKLLRHVC